MEWKRARTEDQVRVRTEAILAAAGALVDAGSMGSVTLAAVAEASGFTRSNLYKYFATKEDLFLALFQADTGLWAQDLESLLAGRPAAEAWVSSWESHPRLGRFLTVLYTGIEPLASAPALATFKTHLAGVGRRVASLPGLGSFETVTALLSLTMGFLPLLGLEPHQKEAMAAAGLPVDRDFYRQLFVASAQALLGHLGPEAFKNTNM